jgi:hypothetical protein
VLVAGIAAATWLLFAGGAGTTAPAPAESAQASKTDGDAEAADVRRTAREAPPPGTARTEPGRSRPRSATGESTVTGRVVDAVSRAGIARAQVVLRHPFGEFTATAESGADGAFTLDAVPGVLGARLFLTRGGYGPKLVRDVHVPPRDRLDLGTIEMHKGTVIGGRVVAALGAPVAGAQVDLIESSYSRPGDTQDLTEIFREMRRDQDVLDQVVTAADGTFAFPAAAPGSYVLAARKTGWQVRFSSPVTVAAGAATLHVELRLIEARGLRGIVKNEAGNPIAGAEVAALELDGATTAFPKSQKTVTGADGRFAYSTFGHGQVALVVQAAGYSGATMGNLVPAGKDVEIVLKRACRIEGRVFDRVTGKGLSGAVVIAFRLAEQVAVEETRTDPEGRYAIETGPSGSGVGVFAKLGGYVMEAVADDSIEQEPRRLNREIDSEDEFVAGSTMKIDLAMVGGGPIGGRVVDEATGEGIAGAAVVVRHRTGSEPIAFSDPIRATSGRDGAFTTPPVGAGKVTLTAHADGYVAPLAVDGEEDPEQAAGMARPTEVEIRPGASLTNVLVKLSRGVSIEVLVTDADKNPVPGANVTWMVPNEETVELFGPRKQPRAAASDGSGTARLGGLPARSGIVVAARHPDFPTGGHVVVDTAPPPGRPVTLTLTRSAAIAGILLGDDGRPVSNREIRYTPQRNEVSRAFGEWNWLGQRALSDVSGKFLLENLPPGPGLISVGADKQGRDEPWTEVLLDPSEGNVDLVAGKREEVTLRLVRTQSIAGTVFDAAGRPLKSLIHATPVRGGHGESWEQGGEDGAFVLTDLRPGDYDLEVIVQTEAGPKKLARVVAAGSSGVEFRFPKGE